VPEQASRRKGKPREGGRKGGSRNNYKKNSSKAGDQPFRKGTAIKKEKKKEANR